MKQKFVILNMNKDAFISKQEIISGPNSIRHTVIMQDALIFGDYESAKIVIETLLSDETNKEVYQVVGFYCNRKL